MKRFLPFILLLAAPCFAADPPTTPAPAVPSIYPPNIAPTPAPSPAAPQQLTASEMIVLQSDVPLTILFSPDSGLVKVGSEAGPIKIKSNFGGKIECRTFSAKFVYTLEASGTGTVELIALAQGSTTPLRQMLAVDNGVPPGPVPPTPTDPLTVALQQAYTADADPAKAANLKQLAALCSVTATLNDATVTNYGQLLTKFHGARLALMPATALPSVVPAVGKWLNTQLPTDPNTALDKTKVAAVFNKLERRFAGGQAVNADFNCGVAIGAFVILTLWSLEKFTAWLATQFQSKEN